VTVVVVVNIFVEVADLSAENNVRIQRSVLSEQWNAITTICIHALSTFYVSVNYNVLNRSCQTFFLRSS